MHHNIIKRRKIESFLFKATQHSALKNMTSPEQGKIESSVEPSVEPNVEPSVEPNVESSVEPSVELNKTFTHVIENYKFGNLSTEVCGEIFKDGRPFSHFIERWL